ncbi:MAG: diguanylate cyclase [Actinobacteria bacterium]|nr:diguanylate cyclase [Actinomycetota bacterium]
MRRWRPLRAWWARWACPLAILIASGTLVAAMTWGLTTFGPAFAALGIIPSALDGRLLYANPALGHIAQRDAHALPGAPFGDLMHPDDRPHLQEHFAALARGVTDAMALDLRLRRDAATPGWARVTLGLIRTSDGVPGFAVAIVEDVTEERAHTAALEHQALYDPLTDLPNRVLFLDRLAHAIESARRDELPVVLLLLDLDRFKEVNDTLGHHWGDSLLRKLARRIRAELRGSETIARLGGDEFAVLLPPGEGLPAAQSVATRILAALEAPFEIDGRVLDVGCSIGIALYPASGRNATTLLRRADLAMYTAKHAKAGFAMFAPEQEHHTPHRLSFTSELRHAIHSGQLRLHYQPVVDMASGQVNHVEALVRWEHP